MLGNCTYKLIKLRPTGVKYVSFVFMSLYELTDCLVDTLHMVMTMRLFTVLHEKSIVNFHGNAFPLLRIWIFIISITTSKFISDNEH